ncbi:glycosyltransferase family A protein [Palleronia rufa]|uniref:glycosyltransferase family A protein n=1 Tax=Palleronia rufa TaxID=1530186 RepID=UPI00055FFC0D|nr:glycosyltransferase family 2 protein [Palleronia rufa]
MSTITLAMTVHAETHVAGPTMHSAEAAIAAAEAAGHWVERLIGMDTPTAAARAYFNRPAFAPWRRIEVACRDQGLARNALVAEAQGHYVAFLDADDLFSQNWLANAADCLDVAGTAGRRVIVHPELNWQFDAIQNVYANPPQDDPFFSPHVMSTANYYDALCMAPRAAWQELGFPARDVAGGFAMEDYQWFVEATARGWEHDVARDTIIFKRRRDLSQSVEARGRTALIRAIEPLAIDRVRHMAAGTAGGGSDNG